MVNDWSTFILILGAGVVTLLTRASFIVMPADVRLPDWFQRALKYVGAAVLPALILPDVLFREVPPGDWLNAHRLLAAVVAGAVAWRTRSIFATLGAGMATLWLLMWWRPF
jgi:branched-subunit amino acid transport protein